MFYGPGGPYALFAGKDASRALAKMSFEEKDLTGDISGLGPFELDALQDWEYKFMSKYVKVGTVKSEVPVTTESESTAEPSETTFRDIDAAAPVVKSDETPSNTEAVKEEWWLSGPTMPLTKWREKKKKNFIVKTEQM